MWVGRRRVAVTGRLLIQRVALELRPQRWGSESGRCLESVPKWGYSKYEGLTLGWLGLLQQRQGGHCGQRRQSWEHSRRCSQLFRGSPRPGRGRLAWDRSQHRTVNSGGIGHKCGSWESKKQGGNWGGHWEAFTIIWHNKGGQTGVAAVEAVTSWILDIF